MIISDDNKKFKYIFLGCLVVAIAIILFTFLRPSRTGIDYKELIRAKDETIQVLREQRPIFEKQIDELKGFINDHKRNDSLLVAQIQANRQTIKNVDDRIKNIPARIAAIANDNDSLRRAIADL